MLRRLLWILGVPMLSLAQPVLPPTVCSASVTTNCVVVTSGAGAYIPVLPIASLAPIADQRVLGNVSGGSAAAAALTLAQILTFLGGTTGSGTVVLSGSPTLTTPAIGAATGTSVVLSGVASAGTYATGGNCSSAAAPAACGSAAAGSAVIAAAGTTVTVNTSAVTASSQILVTEDQSLGTKLSVTCNTQSSLVVGTPRVTARSTGVSFTVAVDVGPTANPLCFSYSIVN